MKKKTMGHIYADDHQQTGANFESYQSSCKIEGFRGLVLLSELLVS